MVKGRISATVDEKTIKIIERILSKGKFRNKSHVIEEAIELLSEENYGK
jgi:Arc/MetJ-type ribon-helix-helix transcriptional regulator